MVNVIETCSQVNQINSTFCLTLDLVDYYKYQLK
jgi:hypothetical protein